MVETQQNLFQHAPFGYALHKIILDDAHKPVDYQFIEVNEAFEKLTGLKKDAIIGKTATQVIPGIDREKFDWIGFYGNIALTGGSENFEQFSEPLGRQYRVQTYSPQKEFFITIFTERSPEVSLSQIASKFNEFTAVNLDVQYIADKARELSGAKYVVVNRFEPNGRDFTTISISGISENVQKAVSVLGFDLINKTWEYDGEREKKIAGSKTTVFDNLTDLAHTRISKTSIAMLSRIFNLKKIAIIKSTKDDKMLGDFTLFFDESHEFKNREAAEVMADLTGMLFLRLDNEEEIKKSKDQFALAVKGTNDGIWDWNIQTNELFLSERWKEIIGYQDHEIENSYESFISFMSDEDVPRVTDFVKQYLDGKINKYEYEFRMKHKNGELVWVLARGEALRDENGVPYRMAGSHSDINERKKIEYELKQNQDRLELAMDAGEHGFWDWDLVTNTTYFSPGYFTMLGYQDKELPMNLETFMQLIHPEDAKLVMPTVQKSIEVGRPYEVEFRLQCKDGTYKWIMGKGKTYQADGTGKPHRAVGVHIDINDRKLTEVKLKESEQNFRTFFETMDDMIFIGNQEGEIFYTNPAVVQKLGYSSKELAQMHVLDVHPKDKRNEAERIFGEMFAGKLDACPLSLSAKDGSLIPVETRVWFGRWDGLDCIFSISKDLTKQQEALQMFDKMFDSNPALMAVSSIEQNNFIKVNNSLTDMLGYSKEEILGQTPDKLNIFPNNNAQREIALQLESQGHVRNVELQVRTKSGEILDGLFSGEIIESQEKKFFLSVMVDITERKKAEGDLQLAKEQAESASKAKSEFLANMSHEIRTPLNGVIGFTDLLKTTPLSPVQQQYVENANFSGHTLLGIINDILDFSKIEAGMLHLELIKVDIIELLHNSIDIIKYASSKKNLELLLDIDAKMPRYALVDPIRLKQILANLLGNAVKFTDKGEVELKVTYEDLVDNKGKFIFSVRDTGIGISDTQRDKLFKAFSQADSSTTRKFGGTGLGLIISDMIAQKMKSKICFESKQDEGSIFFFEIITDIEDDTKKESLVLDKVKRCLIIDDNANNRIILEHMLAVWGIICDSCDNGLSALKLLESSTGFDVIICDYNMPFMDGLETIRMIREKLKLTPDKQPVILLHSSSEDADLHRRCDELGIRFRLIKPVKSHDLYAYLNSIYETENTTKKTDQIVDHEKSLSGKSARILIAEDVEMNMLLFKTMLTKLVPEAILLEASNGKDALLQYEREQPDLIFMDVQMPEMDGIDATKEIRRRENTSAKHTPIVALTAGAFKEEQKKCQAAGMDYFLSKPVETEKIQSVLENFLFLSAPHAKQKHFDKAAFIKRLDNDTLAADMLALALTVFPEKLNQLYGLIAKKDIEGVRKMAHAIKGSALTIDCAIFAAIAAKIEEHATQIKNLSAIEKLAEALNEEWNIIKIEISK